MTHLLHRSNPPPDCMPDGSPWPRITVVTPSFNQGMYLEETLLSVRAQGYPNVEHIVIDGGSTDETVEILRRYDDGLAYWVSEPDRGQSHAINKGFERATGHIVTWLNSDDAFAPGALHAAALAFHQSGADLVAGIVELYRDDELAGRHITSCGNGPLPVRELLDLDNCWNAGQFFYQPEVLFTRDLWERSGAHVSEKWHFSMDYELWLRFAAAGANLQVIGRPMVRFRLHDEQKTSDLQFMEELPRARDAFVEEQGLTFEPPLKRKTVERLRIALVNDVGYHFGAGIGQRRVAQALATAGHEVLPIMLRAPDLPRWAPHEIAEALARRLGSAKPDLVVFGNLHGAFVDAALVEEVARRIPCVVTLHDLWWITGWCAYPGGCEGHLAGCSGPCHCPYDYPGYVPDDIPSACRSRRALLAEPTGPALWANSRWTADQVAHATALGDDGSPVTPRTAVVPLGLDTRVFMPRDRRQCREALGVPRDAFVIMTTAVELRDPRKGLSLLADAMELMEGPEPVVLAPGDAPRGTTIPIRGMRSLGYLQDPADMAQAYCAADLLVGPSVEEALGMVFLEAAACGTPSVGFDVGGVSEAIADGVSGVVVPTPSAQALADTLTSLRDDPERRHQLGAWGRIWVENTWSVEAASHGVTRALWDTGLAEQFDLDRKIRLRDRAIEAPEPIYLFERLGVGSMLRSARQLRMEALRWALRLWRALPLEPRMRFRDGVERLAGRRFRPPW